MPEHIQEPPWLLFHLRRKSFSLGHLPDQNLTPTVASSPTWWKNAEQLRCDYWLPTLHAFPIWGGKGFLLRRLLLTLLPPYRATFWNLISIFNHFIDGFPCQMTYSLFVESQAPVSSFCLLLVLVSAYMDMIPFVPCLVLEHGIVCTNSSEVDCI